MTDCNFDTQVKIQTIHVDFGKVEVGCTAVRTIKVLNQNDVSLRKNLANYIRILKNPKINFYSF